jgi:hypothetical protein
MIQQPRQIEDDEFVQAFLNQIMRLDLQILNLEAGHNVVRDDLASSLRTLFCRGKGNDALRRLCNRFKKIQPKIKISKPITDREMLLFGFSGIPIEESEEGIEVQVPNDLSSTKCTLVKVENELLEINWEQVVEAYGNTFGSHLSRTIPALFDRVQMYGLGHVDFGSFMLRNLAVAISSCAHSLLGELIENYRPKSHNRYFNGIQISTATYYRRDGKEYLKANVRKENWKVAGKIMTVQTPEKEILEFSVSDGGYISLRIIK